MLPFFWDFFYLYWLSILRVSGTRCSSLLFTEGNCVQRQLIKAKFKLWLVTFKLNLLSRFVSSFHTHRKRRLEEFCFLTVPFLWTLNCLREFNQIQLKLELVQIKGNFDDQASMWERLGPCMFHIWSDTALWREYLIISVHESWRFLWKICSLDYATSVM